jgi:hypothetical protein
MVKEPMLKMAKAGSAAATGAKKERQAMQAAKTRKVVRKAVASGRLTKRAATVIKRGSREINRGPAGGSVARFTRSAVRDIAGQKGKGYKRALVKSAATSATKAEAKGVRKVLSRQGRKRPAGQKLLRGQR